MPEVWYRCLYRVVNWVYFARLTLLHPERLPEPGRPVLYLGLHRNGAVDGFVYYQVLRRPVFMISTQLRKGWFARLFFQGIAVTRSKDEGSRGENDAAMGQCLEHLRGGGGLFIFPEGTSSLGPRHLPFKSGAAWLIQEYLDSGGPPLQVIPVGIHYECPWAFRSRVEVVLGAPISVQVGPGATRLAQLKEIKRRIQTGLEEVGVNVASDEQQDRIQRLAYAATLATPRSYFKSLKALEKGIPEPILEAANGLEPELGRTRLLLHQGVPLFPMGPVWIYGLALAVFGPVVLGGLLLNLPPFLAGWFAGKKFPDDRNVISLWKVLVGVPVFVLWAAAVVLVLLGAGKPLLAALYVLVSWLGLGLYYRVKKLGVAVSNGLRYPELKARMLGLRQTVLNALPDFRKSEGRRPKWKGMGKTFLAGRELLPHEVFFGLFLVVTWVRLVVVTGFFSRDALIYLGLLGLNAVAVWYYRSSESPRRWRLGLLYYPLAMNLVFAHMKVAIPRLHPGRMDAWLQQLDSLLIGTNLSLRAQGLVHPVLTEFFSFCYILFFPYLLFSMVYYFLGELELLKKFVIGLFTIYGLGFLGYSLVPAAGPYVAMAGQFSIPLAGGWFTQWNAAVVAHGSNGVDVFPSLHCAISCFFLFFDKRHRPWRFKLYLLPCVGLWLSTIYLRYHYCIDLICGFGLAALALWLANRFPLKTTTRNPEPEPAPVPMVNPKAL